ncbi:hypothetical protein SERLA73DRAFT_149293 [Serpula lacrymans var. lacrymans S7.3]|uniref:DUF6589 domain-containing protein n=1 Tax=Serpula lacrymans var. lacrymans (strain S7.3) TaxID=936435 RepID=F8PHF5_SERL3|nr:hypothetical protein SERLA73DRAFT_149293 [Serpula lacrymans var. lacrymans S7.3]
MLALAQELYLFAMKAHRSIFHVKSCLHHSAYLRIWDPRIGRESHMIKGFAGTAVKMQDFDDDFDDSALDIKELIRRQKLEERKNLSTDVILTDIDFPHLDADKMHVSGMEDAVYNLIKTQLILNDTTLGDRLVIFSGDEWNAVAGNMSGHIIGQYREALGGFESLDFHICRREKSLSLKFFCNFKWEFSPALVLAIFSNWLVNMYGLPGRFIELNLLQEHSNFWLEEIVQHKRKEFDDPYYCWVISMHVLFFLHLKEEMEGMVLLQPWTKSHGTRGDKNELQVIMKKLWKEEVHRRRPGQDLGFLAQDDFDVGLDLMQNGKLQNLITRTTQIQESSTVLESVRVFIAGSGMGDWELTSRISYVMDVVCKSLDGQDLMALVPMGGGKMGYIFMYMLIISALANIPTLCQPKEIVPKDPAMVAIFPTNGLEEVVELEFQKYGLNAIAINSYTI